MGQRRRQQQRQQHRGGDCGCGQTCMRGHCGVVAVAGGGGEGGKKPTQVDHVTTCKKHTSSSFCQTRNSNCRRTHRQHKLKRAIKYAFRRLSRGRDQFTGYHTLTT